jgi:hypothetical protein
MILDRMAQIKDDWQEFLPRFNFPQPNGFYAFREKPPHPVSAAPFRSATPVAAGCRPDAVSPDAAFPQPVFQFRFPGSPPVPNGLQDAGQRHRPADGSCRWSNIPSNACCWGACNAAIAPSSMWVFCAPSRGAPSTPATVPAAAAATACVKSIRIVGVSGSVPTTGWPPMEKSRQMCEGCVPPRMWELNNTSSWLNFHLRRDHQSNGSEIAGFCRQATCRLLPEGGRRKAEGGRRKAELTY